MRIVFMGTPDYSVLSLSALYDSGYDIAAVFAQPDKPVGRKQILTPPPTKVFANEKGIPVFQPQTLKDETVYETLKELSPDIIVVVAYGKILPENILNLPKYGCVNGHASLLPKLRGASPIQWAIVTGETKTGVTTMFMDKGMDTGDILETAEVTIGENETGEELFNRMSKISAELMISTLKKLEKGEITPKKQNENEATYAPIIKKEMAQLDFNNNAQTVHNAIRGFYSWPCAYFYLDGKRIKVISSKIGGKTKMQPSTVIKSDNTFEISCSDNTSIILLKIQPEGKSVMNAEDFLRGKNIPVGTKVY